MDNDSPHVQFNGYLNGRQILITRAYVCMPALVVNQCTVHLKLALKGQALQLVYRITDNRLVEKGRLPPKMYQ